MRYFFFEPLPPSGRTMIVGCRFSSGESVTTSCDMPVTSSTCSCMVDAVDQVFEVDHAADFGQDRERVRIPFEQDLVGLHRRAVFDQ